ncbi:hypothetical protein ALTERO38_20275 [Alteromonas sp. 38]|nr:hypothetical protein ALTER154_100264 [Alteromonas sp. 154]VXB04104.1 hypothetical protein ALTERO38_20275 [Alteromonas sp. 38]
MSNSKIEFFSFDQPFDRKFHIRITHGHWFKKNMRTQAFIVKQLCFFR